MELEEEIFYGLVVNYDWVLLTRRHMHFWQIPSHF